MNVVAYVRAALERECADVTATRAGRNDRLNRAAFALGQFVGSGALPRAEAEHCLFAAAQACGYVATDGPIAARTTIRSGLDKGEKSPREVPGTGSPVKRPTSPPSSPPAIEGVIADTEDEATQRFALAIWKEAVDAHNTIAETYLKSRRLMLDAELGDRVLRFHASCPYGKGIRHPCLVALFRNILTNEPTAIHRIALTPEGQKIGRKMLGPVRGAAIKLDSDSDVSMGLAIGEGIETCLAARQLGFRPVWALGSVGAISDLPVLPGIDGLTLLAEAGEPSAKAIQACGRRWTEAGCEVIVASPRIGSDINDALQGKAA